MQIDHTDDKSTLAQVVACCRWALPVPKLRQIYVTIWCHQSSVQKYGSECGNKIWHISGLTLKQVGE